MGEKELKMGFCDDDEDDIQRIDVTIDFTGVTDEHKSTCNVLAELIRQFRLNQADDPANRRGWWRFTVKLDKNGRAVLLGNAGTIANPRVREPQMIECGCNTTIGALHAQRGTRA